MGRCGLGCRFNKMLIKNTCRYYTIRYKKLLQSSILIITTKPIITGLYNIQRIWFLTKKKEELKETVKQFSKIIKFR